MTSDQQSPTRSPGYEKRDANPRAILLTAIVSIIVVVITVVALFSFFETTRETVYQRQVLQPVSRDLLNLRAVEDSVLTSYELIDPGTGTYRIPIRRAMELLVAESSGTSSVP